MFRRSTQIFLIAALGWFVATTACAGSANAEAALAEAAAEGHGAAAEGHGAAAEGHGAAAEGHGAAAEGHGASHSEHAAPTFSDINWFYGVFGEKEGATPSFATRPKGMGPPFLATLINWGILVGLIVVIARKQIPAALAKRRAQIIQGMDDAAKMVVESRARLDELDQKLSRIDSEIERIKTEMARAGELERERILEEAVERRVRMEREARRLIDTELEAAHESLRRFVVEQALANARLTIESQLEPADQQRMFDDAMGHLRRLPASSLGGPA